MPQFDPADIQEAVLTLERGGVVLYPTETAYGLGCDARNGEGVEKIYTIKGRDHAKSLPLIAASEEMVERYAYLPLAAHTIAAAHWPGPLTLVLEARPDAPLAPGVVAEDGTIAVRVSSNASARMLSAVLDAPIISTSANTSGSGTCYSLNDVRVQLGEAFDLIDSVLDAGPLPPIPPTTIARVHEDGRVEILRQGEIHIV